MLKTLKRMTCVTLSAGILATGLAVPHEAQAVGSHYYNGMHEPSQSTGYEKARKISNNNISMERFKYNKKTNYRAVGRVSNRDGWKGKGKDSMGTGFMIDDHTFLTNSHVVEDSSEKKTKPKHVKLQLRRDGKKSHMNSKPLKLLKSLPMTSQWLIQKKTCEKKQIPNHLN